MTIHETPQSHGCSGVGSSQVRSSCRKGWRKEKAFDICFCPLLEQLLICGGEENTSTKETAKAYSYQSHLTWAGERHIFYLSVDQKMMLNCYPKINATGTLHREKVLSLPNFL